MGEGHLIFFNYLVNHVEFMPAVEHSWKQECRGSAMYTAFERFKSIYKRKTETHSLHIIKGIHEKIDQARQQREDVQIQLKTHITDASLLVTEQECSSNLRKWLKIEEPALKQKARL